MNSKRVAIIGGGPGGLLTAYLLRKNSHFPCEITIFEASDRLGGKIITNEFEAAPIRYEAGAAELYDYSALGHDPLRELIDELGLAVRPMKGRAIILDDHILRTPDDLLREFGENTFGAYQEFARTARAAISPTEYYESDWKADDDDPLSRQSFYESLAQVGDETARRYIEVMIHSDLATESHLTNARYGLQNFLMNEPEYMNLYTIVGGIESLPGALSEQISACILLNHRVVRVEKTPGATYAVSFRHGGETRSKEFDFVVTALPNDWIPSITWGGRLLADAMYRHHIHYEYPAHYLRVSVLFEKPFWRDLIDESWFVLDSFGGCCVYDESSRSAAGPYGVLGWLLAGDAAMSMSNLDNRALIGAVLDSLPPVLRHGRDYFIEGQVHRWVGAVNGLPGGVPVIEPELRHQPEPEQHPKIFVVGDYLFDSTLNGVLDSAELVVDWIIEELEEGDRPALAAADFDAGNPTLPGQL